MVATSTSEVNPSISSNFDRASALKAFDDTKSGVKGLVDAGIETIPQIFIQPSQCLPKVSTTSNTSSIFTIPTIDLEFVDKSPADHEKIVGKIKNASEGLGFFQVVNHGIPVSLLEDMLNGIRRFYDQDHEVKKEFYTRDYATRKFVYNSNSDLFSAPAANWRDSFLCFMAPNPPDPQDLPAVCRDVQIEFTKQVMKLGSLLFDLLFEALGLNKSHLRDMDCNEGLAFVGHCYPACPQPELTIGASKHTDDDFITVVLQDHIGGLQVLHQDQWIDVPPTPGALVVNIGDLVQLISNDRFKSVEHRVVANRDGPRVSVACFFSTSLLPSSKLYGPIKELLSEDEAPIYRETTVHEFVSYKFSKARDGVSPLLHFKL